MACLCDQKKENSYIYDHKAVPSLLMTLGFFIENSKTLCNKKTIKALGRKAWNTETTEGNQWNKRRWGIYLWRKKEALGPKEYFL